MVLALFRGLGGGQGLNDLSRSAGLRARQETEHVFIAAHVICKCVHFIAITVRAPTFCASVDHYFYIVNANVRS
jgi:hypothetical protein